MSTPYQVGRKGWKQTKYFTPKRKKKEEKGDEKKKETAADKDQQQKEKGLLHRGYA